MMSITYLSDTTSISDQNKVDSPPKILAAVNANAERGIEDRLDRVKRAGPDVAIDNTQRAQVSAAIGALREDVDCE